MIDLKSAVKIALTSSADLFGATTDARFEEVESDTEKNQEVWRITISRPRPPESINESLDRAANWMRPPRRDYRVFTISKSDGAVLSVKLREFSVV